MAEKTTGFQESGYLTKKGTTSEKLNQMPPGYDIADQINADINPMPMKQVTSTSYPGDGYGGE